MIPTDCGHDAEHRLLLVEAADAPSRYLLVGEENRPRLNVAVARSLTEALERIGAETFDLVVLNLALPDSQGLETLIRFRSRNVLLPVVALDASAECSLGLQALKNGAQDYLTKDEHFPRLLRRAVLHAIERQRTELALREAKAEADRANKAKSDFLSSMSHELRTPMNAILGFSQLLLHNPKESLSDNQRDYVGCILKAGDHLLELINLVLDLAKIEAEKIELTPEPVVVVELIEDCLALVAPMAAKAGLSLGASPMDRRVTVYADPTRLKQVLINFLSNAVKYNRPQGSVTVTIEARSDNWVRVAVTDTGNGIPTERQDEVFLPFKRLAPENTEVEGHGIGLAIVRELIGHMGGAVGLDSTMGEGSTFWFELPRHVDATSATAKAPAEASGRVGGGYTLLYVEDNVANRRLIELLASRQEEICFLGAASAEEGIRLASEFRPDVIVMDIALPGMDGYEALKCLRAMEETRFIPVIALTASAMPHEVDRGLKAGFERYLTKPVDLRQFLGSVRSALKTGKW